MWQVLEEERPFLMAYRGPFDGFHVTEVAVSKTCLVGIVKLIECRVVHQFKILFL